MNEENAKESHDSLEKYQEMIKGMLWLKTLEICERTLADYYSNIDAIGITYWDKLVSIQHKVYNGYRDDGKPKNFTLPVVLNKEKHGIMQSNKFVNFNRDYVIKEIGADYLTCEFQYRLYIFDFKVLHMMFSIFYEQIERHIGMKKYKNGYCSHYCVVFDFDKFLELYYRTVKARTECFNEYESILTDNTDVSVKAMKEILDSDSVESKDKKSLKAFWEKYKEARPEGAIDVKDPLEFLKQIEGKG